MDTSQMPGLSAAELRTRLCSQGGECALLDVREGARFAEGHLLRASSLPVDRIEADIARLVPGQTTPLVLCDDKDGLAAVAAEKFSGLGYRTIDILDGGVQAWRDAGFPLFNGVNVPAKALALFAREALEIEEITVDDLTGLDEEGVTFSIIDCRPAPEFACGTIPGAGNIPGVELALFVRGFAEGTHVVLTCAGRTRGLLAAQTLRDAGFTGRVSALRDGTMGWELSRRRLVRGFARGGAAKSPPIQNIAEVAARAGISVLDHSAWTAWRSDASRTTYLFDVRTLEEYESGHAGGARHVPGGQLIQKFESHAATLGARIVLSDGSGARALATALWLRRMGWDVALLTLDQAGTLEEGTDIFPDLSKDAVPKPYAPGPGREKAMRDYLAGEPDFLDRVREDGSLPLIALSVA
jgi:rhodanese-related sulfurtransferase